MSANNQGLNHHSSITKLFLAEAERFRFLDINDNNKNNPLIRSETFPTIRTAALRPYQQELGQKFNLPLDFTDRVPESFLFHRDRVLVRFFFDIQRQITYMVIKFTSRAEGPPNGVHGGGIGLAIDMAAGHQAWRSNSTNNDGQFLTKSIYLTYEQVIPLNHIVIVRAWTSKRQQINEQNMEVTIECDVVSAAIPTTKKRNNTMITRHCRAETLFASIPIGRALPQFGPPPNISIEEISTILVDISEKWEALHPYIVEDHNLPLVEFGNDADAAIVENHISSILKECPEEYNFCNDFGSTVVDGKNRAWKGLHRGRHFDFIDTGTMRTRLFIEPKEEKRFIGIIWFSKYCIGPKSVHGGAIFAAFDSFLGDAIFRIFGIRCYTLSLKVRYRVGIPLETYAMFPDLTWERNGKVVTMKCRLTDLGDVSSSSSSLSNTGNKGGKITYAQTVGRFVLVNPPAVHKVGVYWDVVKKSKAKGVLSDNGVSQPNNNKSSSL
jgi:acyl-coenzyme A thioesterase PaaI-like protein